MMPEQIQGSSLMKNAAELSNALFDSVPVALLLIDSKGNIVRANPAECRLLGYSLEEMEGETVWNFIANEDEKLSRDRFQGFLDGMQLTTSYRRRFKTKANEYLICELSVQVIRSKSETDPLMLLASVDVTQQISDACARGELARWIEASFRSLPEATIVLDTLGRIRHLNRAAELLLGLSEAEAAGSIAEDLISWSDMRSSDEIPSHYDFQWGISQGWSGSATVVVKGGIAKKLRIRTEPVVDSNGLVLGIASCLSLYP